MEGPVFEISLEEDFGWLNEGESLPVILYQLTMYLISFCIKCCLLGLLAVTARQHCGFTLIIKQSQIVTSSGVPRSCPNELLPNHVLLFMFTEMTESDTGTPEPMAIEVNVEAMAAPDPVPPATPRPLATTPPPETSAVNLEEIRQQNTSFVENLKASSTVKKQKAATHRFVDWLRKKNEMRSLSDIPTDIIDQLLALWLTELRRADGTEYETSSLNSYISAVKCHLNWAMTLTSSQ